MPHLPRLPNRIGAREKDQEAMEAGTGKKGEGLFQPQDEELVAVLKILRACEELHVSEQAITSALLVRGERYPNADALLAAATVVSWASSPTFDGTNAAGLLLAAIKKQPLPTQRPIQNAPQRDNPYELRTCERCDLDFGVRRDGPLARKEPFFCRDCDKLEARWAA